jgi:hypothetical protein
VAIAAEVIEIAKAGVVVAKKLVNDVEKLVAAKQAEIDDANSTAQARWQPKPEPRVEKGEPRSAANR